LRAASSTIPSRSKCWSRPLRSGHPERDGRPACKADLRHSQFMKGGGFM
jgi:hypothetical protein